MLTASEKNDLRAYLKSYKEVCHLKQPSNITFMCDDPIFKILAYVADLELRMDMGLGEIIEKYVPPDK